MDLKARLRSALLSLEDRNLSSQGHLSAKMLIEKLQTAQQVGIFVRELVSGLDKCGRSAANNRVLLLSYLLVTQRHLSPVRALPQAMPSLVAYLQRQHHSTNQEDLATLGTRLGQALATALSGDTALQAGGGGISSSGPYGISVTRWGDTYQLPDRSSSLAASTDSGAGGSLSDAVAPFVADPPWVLNHVLLPLLRVACRGPERDAMAAACAVLIPLVEALGREAARGAGADTGRGAGRGGGDGGGARGPATAVLQRLLGWTFTQLGSVVTPMRTAGVLQLFTGCVQALGGGLEADAAKRILLAATSGLDCAEDWQVRREAANLIRVLAGLALLPEAEAGRGPGAGTRLRGEEVEAGGDLAAVWMVGPHRREFLMQALEPIRHDKFPAVRAAFQAAAAAVAQLPEEPGDAPPHGLKRAAESEERPRPTPIAFPTPSMHRDGLRSSRELPYSHRSSGPLIDEPPPPTPRGRRAGSDPWDGNQADSRQLDQRRTSDWEYQREPSFSGLTEEETQMDSDPPRRTALGRDSGSIWARGAERPPRRRPPPTPVPTASGSGRLDGLYGDDDTDDDGPSRGSRRGITERASATHSAASASTRGPRVTGYGAGGDAFSFNSGMSEHGGREGDEARSGAGGGGGASGSGRSAAAAAPAGDTGLWRSRSRSPGAVGPGAPRPGDLEAEEGSGREPSADRSSWRSVSPPIRDDDMPALLPSKSPRFGATTGGGCTSAPRSAAERERHQPPPRARPIASAAHVPRAQPLPLRRASPPAPRAHQQHQQQHAPPQHQQRAAAAARPPWRCPSRGPSPRRARSTSPNPSGGGGGGEAQSVGAAAVSAGVAPRGASPHQEARPAAGLPSPRGDGDVWRSQQAAPSGGGGGAGGGEGGGGGAGGGEGGAGGRAWFVSGNDDGAGRVPGDYRSRASSPPARPTRPATGPAAGGDGPGQIASSPIRRFRRRDESRISLGWPYGYRPPRGSPRFRRPNTRPAHTDFGVLIYAKDPPPPSPPRPPPPPPAAGSFSNPLYCPGSHDAGVAAGSEPLYRVNLRTHAEEVTALVAMTSPRSPARGRPDDGGGHGRYSDAAVYHQPQADPSVGYGFEPDTGRGEWGYSGPAWEPGPAAVGPPPTQMPREAIAAMAAGAAAATVAAAAGFDSDGNFVGHPQQRLDARVRVMGHPEWHGAGLAGVQGQGLDLDLRAPQSAVPHGHYGAATGLEGYFPGQVRGPGGGTAEGGRWGSEGGQESVSEELDGRIGGIGGDGGGGGGGAVRGGQRGCVAMEHQLQALVEQAQALQASLVRIGRQENGGTRRQRRRWDTQRCPQPHPGTAWGDSDASSPGGRRRDRPATAAAPALGVDAAAAAAAVQQLQLLLQQAAGAQTSLQLLLAGAGTPAALHGAVHRLEQLVTLLQQTGGGVGRAAAGGGAAAVDGDGASMPFGAPSQFPHGTPFAVVRDGIPQPPQPMPRGGATAAASVFGSETTGALQELIRQVEATRQSINQVANAGQMATAPFLSGGPERSGSPSSMPLGKRSLSRRDASRSVSFGRTGSQPSVPLPQPQRSGALGAGRGSGAVPPTPRQPTPPAQQPSQHVSGGLDSSAWPSVAAVEISPGARLDLTAGNPVFEDGAGGGSENRFNAGNWGTNGGVEGYHALGSAPISAAMPTTDLGGPQVQPRLMLSSGRASGAPSGTGMRGASGTATAPTSGAPSTSPSRALERAGEGITAALRSLIQRTGSLRVPGARNDAAPAQPTSLSHSRPLPSAPAIANAGAAVHLRQVQQHQRTELLRQDLNQGDGNGGSGGHGGAVASIGASRWSDGAALATMVPPSSGEHRPSGAASSRSAGPGHQHQQRDASYGLSAGASTLGPPPGSSLRGVGAFASAPAAWAPAGPARDVAHLVPPEAAHVPRIIDFRPLLPVATTRPHVESPGGSPAHLSPAGDGGAVGPGSTPQRAPSPTIQAAISRLRSLGAALAPFDSRLQGAARDTRDTRARPLAVAPSPPPQAAQTAELPAAAATTSSSSPPRRPQPLYPMAVVPRQPRYPASPRNDGFGPGTDSTSSPSVQTVLGPELSHLTISPGISPTGAAPAAAIHTTTVAAARSRARLAALGTAYSDTASSAPPEAASQPRRAEAALRAPPPAPTGAGAGSRSPRSPGARSPLHRLALSSRPGGSPPDESSRVGDPDAPLTARSRRLVASREGSPSPSPSLDAASAVGSTVGRLRLSVAGGGAATVVALASLGGSQDGGVLGSLDLAVQEPLVLDIVASPAGAAASPRSPMRPAGQLAPPPPPPASPRRSDPLTAGGEFGSCRPLSPAGGGATGPTAVAAGAAYSPRGGALQNVGPLSPPPYGGGRGVDGGGGGGGRYVVGSRLDGGSGQVSAGGRAPPAAVAAGGLPIINSTGDLVAIASVTNLDNRPTAWAPRMHAAAAYGSSASGAGQHGEPPPSPQRQLTTSAMEAAPDGDDNEGGGYLLPMLDLRSGPPSPRTGQDLASMFPATAAALTRQGIAEALGEATATISSGGALGIHLAGNESFRSSYAGFGAMPTPRLRSAIDDAGVGAVPTLMPSPDPTLNGPRQQLPRALRRESVQALRDSATGLARSSFEAVREVEELVTRLTLLQQHLARRRTVDGASRPNGMAMVPHLQHDAARADSFEDGGDDDDAVFELPVLHDGR